MIANFHAKAIEAMEGSSLHSCFDRNFDRASDFAKANGIKTYETLEKFLADPELEVITIGTPSGTHIEPALAGINAGKRIIKVLSLYFLMSNEVSNGSCQLTCR